MSLSISSFESPWRFLAALLLLLVLVDASLRFAGARLSRDEQNIRTFTRIAHHLGQHHGTRVLFLGNSLTGQGVREELFREQLQTALGDGVAAAKVSADGSGLCEWYYYLQNHFVQTGLAPDVVVIGFESHDLVDRERSRAEARRLGARACRTEDLPELFEHDVCGFGQRVEVLLSRFWYTAARREAVQHRVLDCAIPHFQQGTQELNRRRRQGLQAQDGDQHSYALLGRLMTMMAASGSRCVFVAMPTNRHYDLPPDLQDAIRSHGGLLVDCRAACPDAELYSDGYHLNARGAELYTQSVAQHLSERLPELLSGPRSVRPARNWQQDQRDDQLQVAEAGGVER